MVIYKLMHKCIYARRFRTIQEFTCLRKARLFRGSPNRWALNTCVEKICVVKNGHYREM